MATPRFTEEEIESRAKKLANEQGPGWEVLLGAEQVGHDTVELRRWRERAIQELVAEQPTVLEVEENAPKTVGLE